MESATEWNTAAPHLKDTYVVRLASRANRSLTMFCLLLLFGVAVAVQGNWRYLYSFFSGPIAMDAQVLAATSYPDGLRNYFVSISGDQSVRSGLQEIETETDQTTQKVVSRTVNAEFVLLAMGNRLLVVKTAPGHVGTRFEGGLLQLPDHVRAHLGYSLRDHPEVMAAVLPVMLDATGFRTTGYWEVPLCLALIAFAGWNLLKVVRRRRNPLLHPILRALARFGPVVDVAATIDQELRGPTLNLADATITDSWILQSGAFQLALVRISDIVWAYGHVTKYRKYSIPLFTTYAAILRSRDGTTLELYGKENDVKRLLGVLAKRVPWAAFGFNEALAKKVRTDWRGFVAAVDSRRTKAA